MSPTWEEDDLDGLESESEADDSRRVRFDVLTLPLPLNVPARVFTLPDAVQAARREQLRRDADHARNHSKRIEELLTKGVRLCRCRMSLC